ncbi:MAG: class I SAM-dependent methyltransferase [Pseudomonadota bacterium]
MTDEDAGFDRRWESDVYAQSRQLNLYPFDVVVALVLSRFGAAPDRSRIRVLDIGSGAGNHLWFLAREGFDAVGVEGSASAAEFARRRLEAGGLSAEIVVGDFARLPWPDESFDLAFDRGSLTHNRRSVVVSALDEARRVLKPGGVFFSQMFGDRHSGIRHGRPLGDGAYDDFASGYLAGIGRTFFAGRADVDALHGARFTLEDVSRVTIETEGAEDPVLDYWNVIARR